MSVREHKQTGSNISFFLNYWSLAAEQSKNNVGLYQWCDGGHTFGPVVHLGTLHDVMMSSVCPPHCQEPPCRLWKPPGVMNTASSVPHQPLIVFLIVQSLKYEVLIPPSEYRQYQGRGHNENQHPPLVYTICKSNQKPVPNSPVQTYDYTREGPVFNAEPFHICRDGSTEDVKSTAFILSH